MPEPLPLPEPKESKSLTLLKKFGEYLKVLKDIVTNFLFIGTLVISAGGGIVKGFKQLFKEAHKAESAVREVPIILKSYTPVANSTSFWEYIWFTAIVILILILCVRALKLIKQEIQKRKDKNDIKL